MATVIDLKHYPSSSLRDVSFRKALLDSLGDELFNISSKRELLYHLLKNIKGIGRYVKNTPESLEKAVYRLLKHYNITRIPRAVLRNVDELDAPIPKQKEHTPMEICWEFVLQLSEAPAVTYQEIRPLVEKDMAELNSLIKWYETLPSIQKFKKKSTPGDNHEERTQIEFYKRCIHEQTIILDHYVNGLKQRAIANAGHWGALKDRMGMYRQFRDRPYRFARFWSLPYFDYRQIDEVSHRLIEMPVNDEVFTKLYYSNKKLFYHRIFRKKPYKQIEQELSYYLAYLPFSRNRESIFKELGRLFRTGRWIGYYALALSQIEGLFTEMHHVVQNVQPGSWSALPGKVKSLRQYSEMSEYYFDYYEYHIPTLRNRFMHVGHEEDYKLRSYDMLFDLRHLLRVFYELKHSYVKVYKLHKRRDSMAFIDFRGFAEYFILLSTMPNAKLVEMQPAITAFEKDFLAKHTDFEYIAGEVIQDMPSELQQFRAELQRQSWFTSVDVTDKKQIAVLLENKKALDGLDFFFRTRPEGFRDLSLYRTYLDQYKKFLPSLPDEEKAALAALDKQHGRQLRAVVDLGKKVLAKGE